MSLAALLLLLSGYLGFVQYWLHTRWTKTGAEVVGVQVYEDVEHSSRRGIRVLYGVRCAVWFRAAGEDHQSQIDFGPIYVSKMDAEIWAARFPHGGQVPILYEPTDPARVRFAGDYHSSYLTASGTLKLAVCLLVAGLLAIMVSKSESSEALESGLAVQD